MALNDVVARCGRMEVTNPWQFIPQGKITEVRIRYGGCVYSIGFTAASHSETYGGDGGTTTRIPFADDEELNAVSGTVGKFSSATVITSLSFHTNKQSYGPYGPEKEIGFTLPATEGELIEINGDQGDYLYSLGVILHLK